MVGIGLTVTVKATPVLVHPDPLFLTVRVPVYAAAGAPAGTAKTIGEAGSATLVTLANPAVIAAALQTILYWFGAPVTAV
jgi:hypothetical protein